jgi:hypothetical protein
MEDPEARRWRFKRGLFRIGLVALIVPPGNLFWLELFSFSQIDAPHPRLILRLMFGMFPKMIF